MSATTQTVKEIEAQFANTAITIDSDDIEARLETLVRDYQVPADEAKRNVINTLLDNNNIDRNDFYRQNDANEHVGCGDITESEQWVDVHAQVRSSERQIVCMRRAAN